MEQTCSAPSGDFLWEACLPRLPEGLVISVCSEADLGEEEITEVLRARSFTKKHLLNRLDGKLMTTVEQAKQAQETQLKNFSEARDLRMAPALTAGTVFMGFLACVGVGLHDSTSILPLVAGVTVTATLLTWLSVRSR